MNDTEFRVKYKSFTLFIDQIVESEDCISYLGQSYEPHYRWRQEGRDGFFRIVDKFKQEVDSYIERNND